MNEVFILRKYTKCTLFDIENFTKKTITLTIAKNFNDPLDSYFADSTDTAFNESKEILTPEIMNSTRITCFANQRKIGKSEQEKFLKNEEILMWTHYSNAHNGICFEYHVPIEKYFAIDSNENFDSSKKYLENVNYMNNFASEFKTIFSPNQNKNFGNLFQSVYFLKDKSFEYENEVRLVIFRENCDNYIQEPFDYLKKIIFGCRCSNNTKYVIQCINEQVYSNKIELYEINNNFEEVKYAKQ